MRNKRHIWHPCSQPHRESIDLPLELQRAEGPYLFFKNGQKIVDGISSWWCKSLGHGHPRLTAALIEQAQRYEHAIHANTTCDVLEELAERLAQLSPSLNKVFFASDGACAVEIAIKLSLHSRHLSDEPKRTEFIALQNSYHGETCGALSISDLGRFKKPYTALLTHTHFIGPLPYVNTRHDPLWHDCSTHWKIIEKQLEPLCETATALVVEPIVQGSAGMRIYSQDFLKRLSSWCKQHNVHLIADEIMTGLGRTGCALACEHADIQPDFITLSKGLTGGFLPCSAVLIHKNIHQLFVDKREVFWHSHTFGGNPLAASVALACLNILEEENIYEKTKTMENSLLDRMQTIAAKSGQLINISGIGGIASATVKGGHEKAQQLCQQALQHGALLRPLGDVIYWFPPLNIGMQTLDELTQMTLDAALLL